MEKELKEIIICGTKVKRPEAGEDEHQAASEGRTTLTPQAQNLSPRPASQLLLKMDHSLLIGRGPPLPPLSAGPNLSLLKIVQADGALAQV